MNLFYEDLPCSICFGEEEIPIITDYRDYIRLFDMVKDEQLTKQEKVYFLSCYFKTQPSDFKEAVNALIDFANMEPLKTSGRTEQSEEDIGEAESAKEVYSFKYDYAYILSGFLQCYQINLRTIDYMHWWEFRCLFNGLPADTEIKQRINYRSMDIRTVKNKDERKRIQRIQEKIKLPNGEMSDYEIGNAFV